MPLKSKSQRPEAEWPDEGFCVRVSTYATERKKKKTAGSALRDAHAGGIVVEVGSWMGWSD
jgi:hypothetical protein